MGKHYSRESLNEIAGGDEEFMAIVAKAFLEEIPPDLKSMTEALENENKDLAYQFAHKMKPNLEMFGIPLNKDVTAIENWTKTMSKNIGQWTVDSVQYSQVSLSLFDVTVFLLLSVI